MSDRTAFQATLYSPRSGTADPYDFDISRRHMKIEKAGSKSHAECTLIEGQDPTWSSSERSFIDGHPLIQILENDAIYPPSIFIRALEHAWRAWRDNELSDTELQTEIGHLFNWVDATTANLPRTDVWRRIF